MSEFYSSLGRRANNTLRNDRSVRTANSILCPSYPNEKVTLILPHPNWSELMLGNLKNIGGPAVARLAKDQGLTPSEDLSDPEQTRINNLNMILTHLGVSCAHLYSFFLSLDRPTVNLISGPVPGCSFVERSPPHVTYRKYKLLMALVDILLYLFLAYLIFLCIRT